jgi:streptogramin lyase
MAAAPDGTVWATGRDYDPKSHQLQGAKLIHIDNDGSQTDTAMPADVNLFGIAVAKDGTVWFADSGSEADPVSNVVKMNPGSGKMTSYPVKRLTSNPSR